MMGSARRLRTGRKLATWSAVVLLIALAAGCQPAGTSGETDTVYERVIQSGVIRASYASYPPYCEMDPNTKELSGVLVEILEEMARRLDLRVEWTEEVGWGGIFEGLNSNRHDIFGAGIWRNAMRGKVGDFTEPIFYNVIKVYGRPYETRFASLEDLNAPGVRIATLDGAMDDAVAQADYPQASRVSVSQLNPWTDVLLNIVTNKADITFAEPAAVNLYLEQNPGTIVELFPDKPVRVFPLSFALKMGQGKFRRMLESALLEMRFDGTLERILKKYEKHPGEFLRVAPAYQLPLH